jgi:diadenosine tetraphosphate (Ap4A) HIT family hydrolase
VVADLSEQEYVRPQRVVRRVGKAVQQVVERGRLYVLSLGSKAGKAHVHWHLVPYPPGLPYEMQQVNRFSWIETATSMNNRRGDGSARLRAAPALAESVEF